MHPKKLVSLPSCDTKCLDLLLETLPTGLLYSLSWQCVGDVDVQKKDIYDQIPLLVPVP